MKIGRPLAYQNLLEILEDYSLYSAASVARLGKEHGFVPADKPQAARCIQSSCSRMIKLHGFPLMGDGTILISGQRPLRGWFGYRFKEVAEENRKNHRNTRLRANRSRQDKRSSKS